MAAPSFIRGGNSLVYCGTAAIPTPSALGPTSTFQVQEFGSFERLILPKINSAGDSTRKFYFTDLNISGTSASAGVIPYSACYGENMDNPRVGHVIDPNIRPTIRLYDPASAGRTTRVGMECGAPREKRIAELVFQGPDAPVTVPAAAGGQVKATYTVPKAFIMGKFGCNVTESDNGAPLYLMNVKINTDSLVNGENGLTLEAAASENLKSPWFGQRIARGAVIEVYLASEDVVVTTGVIPYFTAVDPTDPSLPPEDLAWLIANQ